MTIAQFIIYQINSLDKWALSAYGSTNFWMKSHLKKVKFFLRILKKNTQLHNNRTSVALNIGEMIGKWC
ncbi:MAG: hypothetical protein EBU01_15215 [Crocinitomicaceae bacterium]|nr:hypothetical protein [Crocinitomicaceae bacterium]